ncbi:helix-turn-helix domain-containing protein [Paenactinomyces guangxiensis]|uniref:AraC family transcriptional regulator n=1 Tax=Paenactinomyces guangxiensis TaxID=1490290 RepID=A0A7W1WP04_9BACL|nr:helix-turn-helix domain-containing protein [Paenactinomyces guangxiensis]MBA4493316.1 AraC family transcriptional regulator [Paenactinomyces guangxiensis]MBH8589833.1 AraC family transcriptional regulator [Paenactinomyces guangxiensis]
MYKVMLVDDDYPVLELLSEAINWSDLDMQLQGGYENGASAFEAALREMPDILITDIGMPKMDGLELIQRMKKRKPGLRAAILSCHSEFHYAQKALKLHVQDYLLKDTLNPADLHKLLLQFKESLDRERTVNLQRLQLETLVDRNKEIMKEKFIRATIQQPIVNLDQWKAEAESFGLLFDDGTAYLPVLGMIDSFRSVQQRFMADDIIRFAIDNVIGEVINGDHLKAVAVTYGMKETFFLKPFHHNLRVNPFEEATNLVRRVQNALRRSLKISMSFILGEFCRNPDELKRGLTDLLSSTGQRFYMEKGAIEKKRHVSFAEKDLFTWYEQASREFRVMLIEKNSDTVVPTVSRWMTFLHEKSFPPETVKDWVLKLLLDLKLKLQSLQYFRSTYTVDILHKEILEIDSLTELTDWLISYFQSGISVAEKILGQSKREEVLDACKYISLHLDRKISLEEVAGHLYLNPSYFSRLFKKETGETFIEYVTRMKMNRAKELLDQTSYSVGKICEMLGYDNQSYFIKMFKSHTGLTPVEYRSQKIS